MTITLSGKEYPLRFTVNALCCLEEKTGKSLSQLQSSQMSCLRGLLWCGLMEQCPDMTLEQAGELITAHLQGGGSLNTLSDALAAALEDACFFPRLGRGTPPEMNG
ncbi:MAG: hypothetical protein IJ189_05955 [Clostridia bacterium]|nr:hypothetical protein [Clostridia bacterium]